MCKKRIHQRKTLGFLLHLESRMLVQPWSISTLTQPTFSETKRAAKIRHLRKNQLEIFLQPRPIQMTTPLDITQIIQFHQWKVAWLTWMTSQEENLWNSHIHRTLTLWAALYLPLRRFCFRGTSPIRRQVSPKKNSHRNLINKLQHTTFWRKRNRRCSNKGMRQVVW